MFVKLVRHSLPDRPDWIIIDESVPLGTRYEVMGFASIDTGLILMNELTKEKRPVEDYLLKGNNSMGYLPTGCFEEDTDKQSELK